MGLEAIGADRAYAHVNLLKGENTAPGADIAMHAVPAGSSSGNYNPVSLSLLSSASASWAADFEQIFAWRDDRKRVDILNLSIGYQGIIDGYSETDLRENFGQAITAMAQSGAAEKAILVWAAGNAHGRSCDPSVVTNNCVGGAVDPPALGTVDAVSVEVLPGLAARISELRGHTIAVVALKADDQTIADFSN